MTAPEWLDQAILMWGYWGVLAAVMIETMGVPFPGETALLAAAIYAGTGRPLSIELVILAAATGAILGDNFGYMVGRYGGYPLVRRVLRAFRVPVSALDGGQAYFARHGDKTVFIGRFFSILRVTVAFLAGVNRMPWRRFLIWNALGGIVWATIFGLLGYILGRNLPLLDEVLNVIGVGGTILLAAAIVGGIIFWVARRRAARRRMAAHRLPERTEAQEERPDVSTPERITE
ncbi:MAG TPA: DedA family protein [Ktedonobacterales bacterium]|nr:DedA family protein [Ktedonobacterales bacterium]